LPRLLCWSSRITLWATHLWGVGRCPKSRWYPRDPAWSFLKLRLLEVYANLLISSISSIIILKIGVKSYWANVLKYLPNHFNEIKSIAKA
jgi:hypothetical protein